MLLAENSPRHHDAESKIRVYFVGSNMMSTCVDPFLARLTFSGPRAFSVLPSPSFSLFFNLNSMSSEHQHWAYVWIPILGGFMWFCTVALALPCVPYFSRYSSATLLSMLITWLATGRPHYGAFFLKRSRVYTDFIHSVHGRFYCIHI